jgi:hypothetical protein
MAVNERALLPWLCGAAKIKQLCSHTSIQKAELWSQPFVSLWTGSGAVTMQDPEDTRDAKCRSSAGR